MLVCMHIESESSNCVEILIQKEDFKEMCSLEATKKYMCGPKGRQYICGYLGRTFLYNLPFWIKILFNLDTQTRYATRRAWVSCFGSTEDRVMDVRGQGSP